MQVRCVSLQFQLRTCSQLTPMPSAFAIAVSLLRLLLSRSGSSSRGRAMPLQDRPRLKIILDGGCAVPVKPKGPDAEAHKPLTPAKRDASGNPKKKKKSEMMASQVANTAENARAIFKLRAKTWKMSAGSHKNPCSDERVIWLSERTSPQWGVGCALCSAFMVRAKMWAAQSSRCSRRVFTKWAKFSITSARSMQSSAIRKHAESSLHQAAFRMHFMPGHLETIPVNKDADLALLRGSVPQPSDWLQALAAAKHSLSSRTAMSLSLTDQFVHSTRANISAVTDRAIAQMQTLLQESIRDRKRKLLADASSIALTVDDKSPFRLVRFKAANLAGEVASGIMCLIKPSKMLEDDPELWDADKSQLAADSIAAGIRELCTRFGQRSHDDFLFQRICNAVKSFSADGAAYAQKVGRLIKKFCVNLVVVWRDAAHCVRLAAQNPLDNMPAYSEAWQALFGAKGPLPMLQHSTEWRAKLATLSKKLLQDGLLGGVLKLHCDISAGRNSVGNRVRCLTDACHRFFEFKF